MDRLDDCVGLRGHDREQRVVADVGRLLGPSIAGPRPPDPGEEEGLLVGPRIRAWTLNLGHAYPVTMFANYGPIDSAEQGEIMRKMGYRPARGCSPRRSPRAARQVAGPWIAIAPGSPRLARRLRLRHSRRLCPSRQVWPPSPNLRIAHPKPHQDARPAATASVVRADRRQGRLNHALAKPKRSGRSGWHTPISP